MLALTHHVTFTLGSEMLLLVGAGWRWLPFGAAFFRDQLAALRRQSCALTGRSSAT